MSNQYPNPTPPAVAAATRVTGPPKPAASSPTTPPVDHSSSTARTVSVEPVPVDPASRSPRRPGPDVVRAIAIFGVMLMNYHGYMIFLGAQSQGGMVYEFFEPWVGPLSTRFAATFCLTAGVGVTLLTRNADTRDERTALRWLLVRRGLLLYGVGLVFDYIWSGTILPYYGAMFMVASLLFTLPSVVLLLIGTSAALIAWITNWWVAVQWENEHDMTWFQNPGPRSPRGMLINVFFNGTHPLFPWLAFFCTGIVVGRLYNAHARWRPAALIGGTIGLVVTTIVGRIVGNYDFQSSPLSTLIWSNDPFERGIVYTISALSTALIAFAGITYLADRYADRPPVNLLRRAGQLSLTIYIAHALLFNLIVNWLGWVKPAGLLTNVLFALAMWIITVALAAAYQKRFGRGPAEFVYRRLTNLTIAPG